MATVNVQHGCGHDRVIETPGSEDPEGLLFRHGVAGAVHRTPGPCPDCVAKGMQPLPLPGSEHSAAALAAEEPPAEVAPASPLQTPLRIHPLDWKRLVNSSASPIEPVLIDPENAIFEFEGRDYQVTTDVPPRPAGEIESLQTNVKTQEGDACAAADPPKVAAKKV